MQVTITEHNDWEGETFSYIFDNMSADMILDIKSSLTEEIENEIIEIEENTSHTFESIKKLNKSTKNSYMARYCFYNIPDLSEVEKKEYYNEVFYKAVGLTN